ncbi:MAG: hypothetical protein COX51_02425 [Syntrophobacteraceae bacterium CG23_combo_of_CG06-09_8_20_14_all_50_8]|nr:MAG: hypothetical protein COX51_02425 [Syntrophobacteraceae bacterium CG23_combo_of_CG06-09_8_20_14_all_50_8]
MSLSNSRTTRALPEPAPAKAGGAFYGACPEFVEGPSNLACFSTFYEFIKDTKHNVNPSFSKGEAPSPPFEKGGGRILK